MKFRHPWAKFSRSFLLVLIVGSLASSFLIYNGSSQAASNYHYRFTVDGDGFTSVEINFTSTALSGSSWVFVPNNFSSWNPPVVTSGQITQSQVVSTDQVWTGNMSFYQAFKFSYTSSGLFRMTIRYDFSNGALIIEPRGVFYSPQMGFPSVSEGQAEVFFPDNFTVNSGLAVIAGSTDYPVTIAQPHYVESNLPENVVRMQVEFATSQLTSQYTTVMSSDNETFTFKSVSRYQGYAREIMRFLDRILSNYTNLFNVTLSNVALEWFLPNFQDLLTVGGYVPVTTGSQLGAININIVFVRAVNGTVEVIAAHEVVHRFLGEAGISPNDFLWFHEGMAQYESIGIVSQMGYVAGSQEGTSLQQSGVQLIQLLGGEHFAFLLDWSPSAQPADPSSYYVASYYIVSRLPQIYGHDLYSKFFQLIHGVSISDIDVFALYMSKAANASVVQTLNNWGFNVVDLYTSTEISDKIVEAQKAIAAVNPVFQPYQALSEYLYRRALDDFRNGDDSNGLRLLGYAITVANLAPVLTFLTILAILALIVFIWSAFRRRPRPTAPTVPPAQPTAEPATPPSPSP